MSSINSIVFYGIKFYSEIELDELRLKLKAELKSKFDQFGLEVGICTDNGAGPPLIVVGKIFHLSTDDCKVGFDREQMDGITQSFSQIDESIVKAGYSSKPKFHIDCWEGYCSILNRE